MPTSFNIEGIREIYIMPTNLDIPEDITSKEKNEFIDSKKIKLTIPKQPSATLFSMTSTGE